MTGQSWRRSSRGKLQAARTSSSKRQRQQQQVGWTTTRTMTMAPTRCSGCCQAQSLWAAAC
jgi:hypothetical protein